MTSMTIIAVFIMKIPIIFLNATKKKKCYKSKAVTAKLFGINSAGEFVRNMIPLIDKRATGTQLRCLMDTRGITVKDVQQYLELGSVQSIYHWLNGISMPTIDNLYALSELFQVTIDEIVCGNRKPFGDSGRQILRAYYEIMQERWIA